MVAPLWTPSRARVEQTNLFTFMKRASERTGQDLTTYDALWQWSIRAPAAFWTLIAESADVLWHDTPRSSLTRGAEMIDARWFEGGTLNYAAHLLRHKGPAPAILACSEHNPEPRVISRDALRVQVAHMADFLKRQGVVAGDRVAAWMPHREETIITMLAASSIGAVFSSSSPDFGVRGVLDRFGQIKPKVLLAADGVYYGGKTISNVEKLGAIQQALGENLRCIVGVPVLGELIALPRLTMWEDAVARGPDEPTFAPLPFDHPLYILYSSGTTGKPKCIVHGQGGSLLQHFKELSLHTDVHEGDRVFYYTTCGWMMWNWLVSALSTGATLVLWDGSPVKPDAHALWNMAADQRVTHFGTSPKYLGGCRDLGQHPGQSHDLSALRAVMSTGSPLSDSLFEWVYQEIKPDLQLASISGGTDIVSCFMLGVPTEPVYAGEIQKRGLGMAVDAWTPQGTSAGFETGELVCTEPFPSMPVAFWDDPDRSRYHKAYFDVFPGVWRHGDWIRITEHAGIIVKGRSDATLNPGGVRIGTAEIYAPVEALDAITESVVVGMPEGDDVEITLFVVLAEGHMLDDALKHTILTAIRRSATPRHCPRHIFAAPAIPRTISGKKIEIAVKGALLGHETPNREALANPEALAWFETEGKTLWDQRPV